MKDKIFEVAKNHTENEETAIQLTNELCVLLGVMPSLIWDIAKEIVKKQQYCYRQEPNTEAFDWDDVEEDWFDWINEKINGEED